MVLGEVKAREREIVRKGIDRLEMQIKQYTSVHVSREQVDIVLIKKCKTTDIPALNSAMGNIQKALQRYVGFDGMDPDYRDGIEELMDGVQKWAQDIEEIYNKAEVHSINTSKGDSLEVGVFSDNSKVTVFEFLESAEQAYLAWGNSVQKANRLYNKHLSEEIKSIFNIQYQYFR